MTNYCLLAVQLADLNFEHVLALYVSMHNAYQVLAGGNCTGTQQGNDTKCRGSRHACQQVAMDSHLMQ